MDERITEIRKHLKKKLNPMRYEHTLGVSYTCMALAMRYSANLDQAEMAGLLHDCAKRYDDATIICKCQEHGIVRSGCRQNRSELSATLPCLQQHRSSPC